MTGYVIFMIVLAFVAGIAGFVTGYNVSNHGTVDGILGIDTRDDKKDYYDFVFLTPTDELKKKNYLKIEVKLK